ncbi:MAG: potassium transporter Kup [Bdellovibrionales bacterium CG10_big_fil_rev_8_21_14_0_10_45_34]|nr:MAG: potassium transporter Kup [Bdellovibrionales bacterium CG10_big_fil_rev_8_21_14_0_10_45_34]
MSQHSQSQNALALAALGVVFGDIGTSPLYAVREVFFSSSHLSLSPAHVLGVLSLIFWSLILVISLKYITLLLRSDNDGEGGIMALQALLMKRRTGSPTSRSRFFILLALFGSALLYGDGVITPVISVLGALEGLHVVSPVFDPWVLPLACIIILFIFLLQRFGSQKIGTLYGPIIFIWFVTMAVMGAVAIAEYPQVFWSLNPVHGVRLLLEDGTTSLVILGSVFLVVTGGEALYADMGHFGARAIRRVWFLLVLPCLLLNYFGQGALLLSGRTDITNPFFQLAPSWALIPLVILSVFASIVASQAVISGVFSLTKQAVQLGYCPRVKIVHTSDREIGQIFVPLVNSLMCLVCIWVALTFQESSRLASAYGLAVTATMLITTIIAFVMAKSYYPKALFWLIPITGLFLIVDVGFFVSNAIKFFDGGWLPIAVGIGVFAVMATWNRGRRILAASLDNTSIDVGDFIHKVEVEKTIRISGSAVYMSSTQAKIPRILESLWSYQKVLHKNIILMNVNYLDSPYCRSEDYLEVVELGSGFYSVSFKVGYLQKPDLRRAVATLALQGYPADLDKSVFFFGRDTVIPAKNKQMARWREHLFAWMARNSYRAPNYFDAPLGRVVEIGLQVEV